MRRRHRETVATVTQTVVPWRRSRRRRRRLRKAFADPLHALRERGYISVPRLGWPEVWGALEAYYRPAFLLRSKGRNLASRVCVEGG